MIPAYLYHTFYLIFVSVISLIVFKRYASNMFEVNALRVDFPIALIIALIIAIFIGLRQPSGVYFGDSSNYARTYNLAEGLAFNFSWENGDPLFTNFLFWAASNRLGINFVFMVVSLLYFLLALWADKRIFGGNVFAAFLVFLAAFSTFSYGTNGIRCGLAASFFLLALSYRKHLPICIFFALVSLGIHHAMQLPCGALVLSLLYKNSKVYFAFWVICLLISILHITSFQELFGGFTDEGGASYLLVDPNDDWGGKSGFRWDFVLYSSVPIIIGYIALFKKRIELSLFYKNILNVYLITNGIWMLCMYAHFTNRIAYLSWFLYPVVLIYPFLNEDWGDDRYNTCRKVMLGHLAFTIALQFIYYRF